ncbi:UNVERIFIED_CONTAM: phloem protein 1 [Sesamum calycinum]|uniref:Phloem protein 1 n=1 Tax=Sesamum calycinum TaxID=2727403 RepID=A0AAW2RAE5_9LAMI
MDDVVKALEQLQETGSVKTEEAQKHRRACGEDSSSRKTASLLRLLEKFCTVDILSLFLATWLVVGSELNFSVFMGKGGNPVWNEEFKFRVEYPAAGTDDHNYNYKLVLQIMDHHAFIPDHDLGQTTIYLKEVFERGVEKGEAETGVQKYRVVSTDLTYNGEIQVGVNFTTKV